MNVFSIIVTYNALRNDWLYKCINSLLTSELQTKIIIIDNASTDGTCDIIKEKYSEVILIENNENKGFGAANNQGFEYGIKNNADYFFLLNQDAWIDKNVLNTLLAISILQPEYAVISPTHLTGSGNDLDKAFSNSVIPNSCPNYYSDFVLNKKRNMIYQSKFVNAAAWFIPIETLRIVGGFSPAFFHYGEDDNFCHRILFHQLKVGIVPAVYMYHDRENRAVTLDKEKQSEILRLLHLSLIHI